jgi:sodium/bile acid cotransporter 7
LAGLTRVRSCSSSILPSARQSAKDCGVRFRLWQLARLLVADGVLLAAALITTGLVSKWLGFDRADRVTIVFCGSKKSLSQGIAMAKVIFASHAVRAAILPLMLFHQIQLMACTALAQRPSCGALREIPSAA